MAKKFAKKKKTSLPPPVSVKKKTVKKKVVAPEPTPVKKKKKKAPVVEEEPIVEKKPAKSKVAIEAEKSKERLKRPSRKTEDGYSEDDSLVRAERRPAEYEPRTDPSRGPRARSLRDIWEARFYTMLNQIVSRRCQAHCELEALRDNFRNDTVKHYREIVEIWLSLYTAAAEHEHRLMQIATKEFPNFKPPASVLNWPHLVSQPPDMTQAIKTIHGDKYVDYRDVEKEVQ